MPPAAAAGVPPLPSSRDDFTSLGSGEGGPPPGEGGRGRGRVREGWLSAACLCLVVAIWQAVVQGLRIPAFLVPSPAAVATALVEGFRSGVYVVNTGVTVAEVVLGFLAGSAAGVAVGVIVSLFPLLNRILYPYVVAFQTTPKVAVAPLLVVWFGLGLASKVVITALIAFFPVLVNVLQGLDAAEGDQVDVLRAMTASRWQVFRMVRLPASLPFVFAGLDIAAVFSVIGAIVGEFVGAQAGLGYLIQENDFNLNVAGTFAVLVVLALLGLALHAAIRAVEGRVVFWKRDGRTTVIGT